jgi:hypothetical protein
VIAFVDVSQGGSAAFRYEWTAVEARDVYILSVIDSDLYGSGRNGNRESLSTQTENRLRRHSGVVAARRRPAAKALKLKSPSSLAPGDILGKRLSIDFPGEHITHGADRLHDRGIFWVPLDLLAQPGDLRVD